MDLIYEGGLAKMRYSISDTAEYGDMTRGDAIVTEQTREAMRKVLADVRSGDFAREWVAEADAGSPNFSQMRQKWTAHPIEEVGGRLRDMMPWLQAGK